MRTCTIQGNALVCVCIYEEHAQQDRCVCVYVQRQAWWVVIGLRVQTRGRGSGEGGVWCVPVVMCA